MPQVIVLSPFQKFDLRHKAHKARSDLNTFLLIVGSQAVAPTSLVCFMIHKRTTCYYQPGSRSCCDVRVFPEAKGTTFQPTAFNMASIGACE